MMKPLVILTGPTAVGKSDLSIKLAHAINGEIISADSMQVYKKMDIGTAKIMPDEMDGIKHHLIDVLDITENFDAFQFQMLAKKCIEEIYERGHIPIICGGTGFYIQGILYNIEYTKDAKDDALRDELEEYAKVYGSEKLHARLKELDPQSYGTIPHQNVKRVIRAIEYVTLTGQPISEHNSIMHERKSEYNFAYFVINNDKDILYDRINKRVDIMIQNGLLDEVTNLKTEGLSEELTAGQAIGYREILHYLDGDISYGEAVDAIKTNSRHYAKRQLTWFRREKEVIWLDKTILKTDSEILEKILFELKEKGIVHE